jgi:hypothetical protein
MNDKESDYEKFQLYVRRVITENSRMPDSDNIYVHFSVDDRINYTSKFPFRPRNSQMEKALNFIAAFMEKYSFSDYEVVNGKMPKEINAPLGKTGKEMVSKRRLEVIVDNINCEKLMIRKAA